MMRRTAKTQLARIACACPQLCRLDAFLEPHQHAKTETGNIGAHWQFI
jgi:hypothetical protein